MATTRRRAGVLAPQVEGFRAWLTMRGYTPGTIRNMLKDLGQLGLWLSDHDLAVAQLHADQMKTNFFVPGGRLAVAWFRGSARWRPC